MPKYYKSDGDKVELFNLEENNRQVRDKTIETIKGLLMPCARCAECDFSKFINECIDDYCDLRYKEIWKKLDSLKE